MHIIDVINIGIAVVLMIIGAALPEVVKIIHRRRVLSAAKAVFPVSSVDNNVPVIHIRASFDEIVFGENPPTLRGYTHCGDVQAVMNIYKFFDRLPVRLEFDYFPEIDIYMKNIVIVGTSSRSDVSRELGAELYRRNIRVRGKNRHAHYMDRSGKKYHCEHSKFENGMRVTKDVGIIFRKVTETGAVILMCGGIHTFGSQAAAEVALLPEFQRRIHAAKLEQFVQFVTVDVMISGDRAGLGIIRQSIRWRDLPLDQIVD